jgi:N-acetylglucosamine kinase-like BadF-type ATPase
VTGGSPEIPAVLAVDGGASKTDVWLVGDDGTVLGAARGEGSNHQFSGLDGAIGAIDATVDAALERSGRAVAMRPAARTGVYCLAGIDLPVDLERLAPAIGARRWSEVDLLHNDTMAVLRAGATSGWGVGLVCGSGLNCVGLGHDGTVVRFPSLAELSGDFAPGGAWLGVRALGLALRSRDGRGEPTSLATAVPAHFRLADPEAVLTAVYSGAIEFGRLFELAKVCIDAAGTGDQAAAGAVAFLAEEVVAMGAATIGRLGAAREPVEIVLGGGLFESEHSMLRDEVETGLRRVAPEARFRRLDAAPVLGAALLGLDAIGAGSVAEDLLRARAGAGEPDPVSS